MHVTRDELDWLKTLLAAHRELSEKLDAYGDFDLDPPGTAEMEATVGRLIEKLEVHLDLAEAADEPLTDAEIDARCEAAGLDFIPF